MGKRGPKAGTPAARRGGQACRKAMDTDYYARIGAKGRETQAARRQEAEALPFAPQAAPVTYDTFTDVMAHHRATVEHLRVVQRGDRAMRRAFDFALSQMERYGSPEDRQKAADVRIYEAALAEQDDTPPDAA